MFCDVSQRIKVRGFTLLEVMVAVACLGMVLTAIYSMSAHLTRKQAEVRSTYERVAMARALLDEYTATYPRMPTSGSFKDTWNWLITEEPQEVLEPTHFDTYFRFVRITVKIQRTGKIQDSYESSVVVARRESGI